MARCDRITSQPAYHYPSRITEIQGNEDGDRTDFKYRQCKNVKYYARYFGAILKVQFHSHCYPACHGKSAG
ncbi:hypothetical protein SPLC1_S131140 [Arthrospira platensis C1]|nr:hypothetical protein SPLC1_S131140 [Arthrospira platensis C1]